MCNPMLVVGNAPFRKCHRGGTWQGRYFFSDTPNPRHQYGGEPRDLPSDFLGRLLNLEVMV